MGDLVASTYFTGRTPVRVDSPADLEAWLDTFTIKDSVRAELSGEVFNVNTYGAGSDKSASVNRAAIQSAIDAAEANGGGEVTFEGESYEVDATVTIDSDNVKLVGVGMGATTIKFSNASTETGPVIEFVGSVQINDCGIEKMSVDGNKANVTGSSGCVRLHNVRYFRALQVEVTNSSGEGIYSNTDATGNQTNTNNNVYIDVRSSDCDGNGQHYQGEKNSMWNVLRSENDAADGTDGTGGVVWEGAPSNNLRETTENTVGLVRVSDSGRFGVILDATTKYTFSTLMIHGCEDSPILLRNSNTTGAVSNGTVNMVTFASLVLRNNAKSATYLGWQGIETDNDNTQVSEITVSSYEVRGDNSANASPGVFDIAGWQRAGIGPGGCTSCKGDLYRIDAGELADGSSQAATDITLLGVRGHNSGNASATTNHGIYIGDASRVTCVAPRLRNSLTDGSTSWEIYVDAAADRVELVAPHLDASTNGGELFVHSSARTQVKWTGGSGLVRNDMLYEETVASAATITLPHYANGGVVAISGTTNISTISSMHSGFSCLLVFTDASPGDLLNGSGNVFVRGGSNYSPAQNDAIRVTSNGTHFLAEA